MPGQTFAAARRIRLKSLSLRAPAIPMHKDKAAGMAVATVRKWRSNWGSLSSRKFAGPNSRRRMALPEASAERATVCVAPHSIPRKAGLLFARAIGAQSNQSTGSIEVLTGDVCILWRAVTPCPRWSIESIFYDRSVERRLFFRQDCLIHGSRKNSPTAGVFVDVQRRFGAFTGYFHRAIW